MIPNKFEECNDALNKLLQPVDQIEFMNLPREKLITTHSGLGMWIRNNWGLWRNGPLCQDMKSHGFRHPDDMSGTIIKEYWLYLNKLPSEVKEDLVRYNEHWDAMSAGTTIKVGDTNINIKVGK